ncbi:MAG: hypothetical protein INR68_11600 [Methylobacterium mesophilicum]|nr:hypothetical protein [Methylobacterium mesophilicum]
MDLGALPSAEGQDAPVKAARRFGRPARYIAFTFTTVVLLAFVLIAGLYLVGVSGIGREQMRARAEAAIEKITGRDMVATLGGAHISLDGTRLLALEVNDVALRPEGSDANIADAGTLRFGLLLGGLARGRLELGSVSVENARFVAAPLEGGQPRDWTKPFRNGDALLDPSRVPGVVSDALRRVFLALRTEAPGAVELSNVEIVLPGQVTRSITIDAATLDASSQELVLAGEGSFEGRRWSASGSARSDPATSAVDALNINIVSTPPEGAVATGPMQVSLSGNAQKLDLSASLDEAALDLGKNGILPVRGMVHVSAKSDSDRLSLDDFDAKAGGLTLKGKGTVGPQAIADRGVYDLQLEASRIASLPEGSPDPMLEGKGSVAGEIDPQQRRLTIDRLSVETAAGKVTGNAAIQLADGRTPGVSLSIEVPQMLVAEAKALWPWTAGKGARNWVVEHVRGGAIENSRLSYAVQPGRIGSGIPLGPDELSGEFRILGTEFDTAGEIPAVRAADGYVTLRGMDVDIALASGEMTLPSGKTLRASDGSLALRQVNQRPVVGRLDIDVEGEAPAAAELASLEPISALQRAGFVPGDFSGRVKGNVVSDIPLERGYPREKIDWKVGLQLDGVALNKPFDGQKLTEAKGTIEIDPEKALVKAEAKLNDVPAKLDFTEPVRKDAVTRKRLIELDVNENGLQKLAPGLSSLVDGPMTLKVDASDATQKVSVDLNRTKLALPWVGWGKGAGIAATADFLLKRDGEVMRLSNLKVEGGTFSINGSAVLSGGGLVSAEFPRVQLNRGDDIALNIKRDGKIYDVDVTGKAFDARALLKLVTASGASTEKQTSRGSVLVRARLDTVTGFNNESLQAVFVTYRGSGALKMEGSTDRGASVTVDDDTKRGVRSLRLKSSDAGSVLRFLNIYPNMQSGAIDVALASEGDGPLQGPILARDFMIVNEPRLGSVVSNRAQGSDRSLNDAVRNRIDSSRVKFDRGSAQITKGAGYLRVSDGILRGTTIGATFQGTVFDPRGNIDMTGTFMPAYGLNRVFGEIPLFGAILGNGKDQGLIGVTFKLVGSAKSPDVNINPLSVIAPGIFRRIFEYNQPG